MPSLLPICCFLLILGRNMIVMYGNESWISVQVNTNTDMHLTLRFSHGLVRRPS